MATATHDDGLPPGLSVEGHVATLRLRRPQRLNRLSSADLQEIQRLCTRINEHTDIRAVVLTADTSGQARAVFSAGYDVSGFEDAGHDPRLFEQTVDAVAALRPIVIAGLNGSVYGGATDLVLACDLRIALPGMAWRMPACALGLHYYPSGLQRYLQAMGLERTRQLFMTGNTVHTEQLCDWGVLMELVDAEPWSQRLQELAAQVAQMAPMAVQGTKRSLNELSGVQTNLLALREREAACAASDDFLEGRRAMAERRPPLFKGR